VDAARAMLRPKVAAAVAADLHVWKSTLDGTWQAFHVVLPVGYTPDKKWPLAINFHPLNYIDFDPLNEIQQIAKSGRPVKFQGDRIKLEPWGRGNGFQELGDEEFLATLDYGVNTLGGDKNSVAITGDSDGATDAMIYTQRYSDAVAGVDFRSGGYFSYQPGPEHGIAGLEMQVVAPAYDIMGHAGLLRGISGRLSAGAEDEKFLPSTLRMKDILTGLQSPIDIVIVPKAGHDFRPPSVPPPVFNRPPATIENSVLIEGADLRYANKDGFVVKNLTAFGKPWHLRAFVTSDNTLWIETSNIARFSFTESATGPFTKAKRIMVDGKDVNRISQNYHEITFSESASGWSRNDGVVPADPAVKNPQTAGPIMDLRRKPFLIVCGTKNPETAPAIQARIELIVSKMSGNQRGENDSARYVVVKDTDCTSAMRQGKSVWLIGNRDENSLYDLLAGQAPIAVSNGKMQFGSKVVDGPTKLATFIIPNPESAGNYVYVEAATRREGYVGPVFESRVFDFAVNTIDLKENPLFVRGFFDENWRLKNELTFWRK